MRCAVVATPVLSVEDRAEAKAMNAITLETHSESTRKSLVRLEAERNSVPSMDPAPARELRDRLAAMSKEEKNHVLMTADDPHLASAVWNAAAGGFGLGVSEAAKKKLLEDYNREHRSDLLQKISDAETFLSMIEEFSASVARV